MVHDAYRMASKCPHFESIRFARGLEMGNLPSKDMAPRCDHCAFWSGGSCDLFLAKGYNNNVT